MGYRSSTIAILLGLGLSLEAFGAPLAFLSSHGNCKDVYQHRRLAREQARQEEDQFKRTVLRQLGTNINFCEKCTGQPTIQADYDKVLRLNEQLQGLTIAHRDQEYYARQLLLANARQSQKLIDAKNREDINTISRFIQLQRIPQALSPTEILASSQAIANQMKNYNTQNARLRGSLKDSLEDHFKSLENSIIPIFDPSSSARTYSEFISISTVTPFLKNSFSGKDADQKRFQFLVNRAAQSDTGNYDPLKKAGTGNSPVTSEEDRITPYMAKMILLGYVQRHIVQPRALDSLANSLNLGYQPMGIAKTWNNTLFHNGYVYGAKQADHQAEFAKGSDPKKSAGSDCSFFVDELLSKVTGSVTHRPKKLLYDPGNQRSRTSLAFDERGALKREYQDLFERVYSETQLKPGDIIMKSGHIMIFSGYSEENPPQFMAIEAMGDQNRSIRTTKKNLYRNPGQCEGSAFQEAPWFRLKLDRFAAEN